MKRILTFVVAVVLSAHPLLAADKFEFEVKRLTAVESMKDYPNLIEITVKKNGKLADAKDSEVLLTLLRGDALLYDTKASPVVRGSTVKVKVDENGVARASVLMQKASVALIDVAVVGDPDATKKPVDLNTRDIPAGALLPCSRSETEDCRGRTVLTFYTGYAINTFAAQALSGTNPAADSSQTNSATTQTVIAGIDFSHKIFSRRPDDDAATPDPTHPRLGELWVFGETLHGLQSTNNCSGDGGSDNQPCDAAPETLDGIIKGASSLEAYAGLRWEPQLGWIDNQGARLYVKGQVGFISLVGHGADLIDVHHGGIGMVKVNGAFTDSTFEVGYGRNDLFAPPHHKGRWKFDGLISYNMNWPNESMIRPFLQITADTDFGRFGDSVQSFLGLDFDMTMLKVFSVSGRNRE